MPTTPKWNQGDPRSADDLPRLPLAISGIAAGIGEDGTRLVGLIIEPGEELQGLGLPPKFLANYTIEDFVSIMRQGRDLVDTLIQMQ